MKERTGHSVPSTPAEGGPHPVDLHVGALIRLRRKQLGLTQQHLAGVLGLTFQQVQKYERGTNRVSASKLYEIASTLKMPIEAFFRGLDDDHDGSDFVESGSERGAHAFLHTGEGFEMASAFPKIRVPALRRRIVELVRAMASETAGD